MKSVAILGCGPAGLMVAHAARLHGWDFHIYSKKQKSPLFGAQYLHEPITDITGTDPEDGAVMLSYRLTGTSEEYRHKVYGPTWDGNTSPEDYAGDHYAWDLRTAYDKLWFEYGGEITDFPILRGTERQVKGVTGKRHDLIISTVPRTLWDTNDDHFKASYIWALGDGDYERVHMHRPDPFTVICDGTKDNRWYRVSNIFGFCTMEWPQWYNSPFASVTPPARGAARVAKPLEYTGSAARDIIHLGRYAQWQKGVLASDVFRESMRIFASDSVEVSNGR